MVATRGRTFKRPWRRSCHSSKLKSSSAPIGRKDSWCFHAVGSSNAPLLGSTAAEGLQRIGRTSIATRWRSSGLPQSASCSENFVIPPDVFGQTLRRLSDEKYHIRIITHRLFIHYFHALAVQQTIEWLDHYGIPYHDLCFMKEKEQVGAGIYIEDSPDNIESLRARGFYTICFA